MIESTDNNKIKALRKLKQKKHRDKQQAFLVEGHHLVEEAIEAGVCEQVIHTEDADVDFPRKLLVSDTVFSSLSDVMSPQGVMAVCLKRTDDFSSGDYLLLDHIQDPGNIGTLLRSAKAFGFENIVLDECVDVYNPKVVRATQGTIFKLNMKKMSLVSFLQHHENGFHVYGTDVNKGEPLSSIKPSKDERVALLLGNEGAGVKDSLLRSADDILSIDITGAESLNVAVAGGIIMHRLYERKEK